MVLIGQNWTCLYRLGYLLVFIYDDILCIYIYYCTSEGEIWLDIARVGRCIYTSRRQVKMLPTSAISSHFLLSRVQ